MSRHIFLVGYHLKVRRSAIPNLYFQTHKNNKKTLVWYKINYQYQAKCQFPSFQMVTVIGTQVTDPPKIASEFNKYLVNFPKQIDKGISFTRKSSMDYLQNRVDNSFSLSPTDPNEIEAIILSFSNDKSVAP